MRRGRIVGMFFIVPWLIAFILFWVIPIGFGIFTSFCNYSISGGNGGFCGLSNYIAILTPGTIYSQKFFEGLLNTLIFVVISVPTLVLVSLSLALLLTCLPKKIKPIFRTIFFISYAISVSAVAAVFKQMFTTNGGYINNVLYKFGIDAINWTGQQPYAWLIILIATVWWTIGFNMLLFLNAIDDVDRSLYEAATIDRAGAIARFRYITYPEIRNIVIFVIITTILASFNLYGQSMLITGGGPGHSTTTLVMNLNQIVFKMNNLGMGSAMAILMGIIMMLVTGTQYLLTQKNKKYGGDI